MVGFTVIWHKDAQCGESITLLFDKPQHVVCALGILCAYVFPFVHSGTRAHVPLSGFAPIRLVRVCQVCNGCTLVNYPSQDMI